jgi:predicted DNA-binding transcriptional regulator YafY
MNVKHPDRLYKTDRLNYIVNRMRVRQDITPAKLAEELQVSERTIYRDLRFLEKGQSLKKRYSRREGRYLLENELTLPPLTLTPSEALALYTAASVPTLCSNTFFSEDLRAGLKKLGTALAPDAAKEANAATPMVDSIQRPTLEMIRRAMRSNRKIRVRYWSPAGDGERTLVVAPYDLRPMDNHWYLLANSEDMGGIRTLKINRLRAVEILPERFRFPRRFSADDCFAKTWEVFGNTDNEINVEVRFVPSIAPVIAENCGKQFIRMDKQPDGSLICTAAVNSVKEIAWWILSYGNAAEVLSPPELRTDFARTTMGMAALYIPPPNAL